MLSRLKPKSKVVRAARTADCCVSSLRLASNGETMNATSPKIGTNTSAGLTCRSTFCSDRLSLCSSNRANSGVARPFKQAAARGMIFGVGLQVFGQMLDPASEKCNLHIRAARIFFMQLELRDAQRFRALR